MIHEEFFSIGERNFRRTYSDMYYIIKDGTEEQYIDASDLLPCDFTYSESEELLPDPNTDAELAAVIDDAEEMANDLI